LASVYRKLVLVYRDISNKKKMDKALKNFYQHSDDYYLMYSIASNFDKQGKITLALEYYNKCMNIRGFIANGRVYEYAKNRIQRLKEELFSKQTE
jgi:hypothetical protein